MEALRESFLNLTFQMSLYKRATLDEEDLVDSTGDDIYPSSPMQVNRRHPASKNKQRTYNWYAATTQAREKYQPRKVSQLLGNTALSPNTTAPAITVVQPLIFYRIGCCFLGLGPKCQLRHSMFFRRAGFHWGSILIQCSQLTLKRS